MNTLVGIGVLSLLVWTAVTFLIRVFEWFEWVGRPAYWEQCKGRYARRFWDIDTAG